MKFFASSNYQPRHQKNPKYVKVVSLFHEQNSSRDSTHQWSCWHGGYSVPKASLPLAWDLPQGDLAMHCTVHVAGKFLLRFFSSWWGGKGSSSLWGLQGEPSEGLGCCPGEAKGSRHLHISTVRLLAKVPLTAPPSPKPAT